MTSFEENAIKEAQASVARGLKVVATISALTDAGLAWTRKQHRFESSFSGFTICLVPATTYCGGGGSSAKILLKRSRTDWQIIDSSDKPLQDAIDALIDRVRATRQVDHVSDFLDAVENEAQQRSSPAVEGAANGKSTVRP